MNNNSSNTSKKPKFNSTLKFYTFTTIFGAVRSLAGFPLEHPLDAIKTIWQSNPNRSESMREVISEIYSSKGIGGLYAGGIPNALRMTGKSAYRYSLMIALQNSYSRIFGCEWGKRLQPNADLNSGLIKLFSASSLACIESVIICPLERLKVFSMSRHTENKNYRYFFSQGRGPGYICSQLWKGLLSMVIRQNIAWVVFLESDYYSKKFIRTYIHLNNMDKQIPILYLIPVSVLVSFINVLIVMPFDMVKTEMQKDNPSETIRKAVKNIYSNYGLSSFFVAWRVRLLHYLINGFLTVNLIEKLEHYNRIHIHSLHPK